MGADEAMRLRRSDRYCQTALCCDNVSPRVAEVAKTPKTRLEGHS